MIKVFLMVHPRLVHPSKHILAHRPQCGLECVMLFELWRHILLCYGSTLEPTVLKCPQNIFFAKENFKEMFVNKYG